MADINEVRGIDGVWAVEVVAGPLWFRSLNMIKDKKYIEGDCGINVAKIVGEWGVFRVKKTGRRTCTLVYLDSPIVDKIQIITRNVLFGKFFWKGGFVGLFNMKKVDGGK